MRTKELREFYHILSDLNNSFTHYSLVWSQFDLDYKELLVNNPETLTKDYFTDNPFNQKHNIRFSLLEAEHKKTNQTLINGIFLLIYTNFESYLKNVLAFAIEVNVNIITLENKLGEVEADHILLDKIFNRIGINKTDLPSEELITLDYIRLKRNRLIHSNAENVSKSLNEILKTNGKSLNSYWNAKLPNQLQGINFSDKNNANELDFSIIIDLVNIFRGISINLDKLIIEKLTSEAIIEKFIIPEFKKLQHKNIKVLKFDRLYLKFKKYCESKYSLIIEDEFVENLKSSIA